MDKGLNIKLRRWELNDLNVLVKYANNKKIADNLRNVFPFPYTMEDGKKFIESCLEPNMEDRLVFAIVTNNEAIGCISISKKQDVNCKSAEIGFWVAEEYWSHGAATAAIRQICAAGFKYYDIARIYGTIFANNAGAKHVLQNCGFSYEATLKKSIYKNGVFMDSMIYAIVK